jgi:site-specific DNA-cytosine methylase
LNAACYGLPQTRERGIVIGYRRELDVAPTLPPPTHFGRRAVFDYRTGEVATPSAEAVEALLVTPARERTIERSTRQCECPCSA